MKLFENSDLEIEISIAKTPDTYVNPDKAIQLDIQNWDHDMGSGRTHTTLSLKEAVEISNQLRRYAVVMAAGIDPESNA